MYRLQKYFFLNRVEETGCLEGDFFVCFFVPYFSRVIFFLTYMVNIPKGIFSLNFGIQDKSLVPEHPSDIPLMLEGNLGPWW